MPNWWATEQNDDSGEPDLHISGTIVKSRNGNLATEFWLSRPRPKDISIDDWEAQEQERWDKIFGRKTQTEDKCET